MQDPLANFRPQLPHSRPPLLLLLGRLLRWTFAVLVVVSTDEEEVGSSSRYTVDFAIEFNLIRGTQREGGRRAKGEGIGNLPHILITLILL